jgi:class 3 adenylate cyclase
VTPHIVAQQLVPPGAERGVALQLEPGRYRLRALGVAGGRHVLAVEDGALVQTLSAGHGDWPADELSVGLAPELRFVNAGDAERLFILERTAWSDHALTAAEVIGMQSFRDLFARELLRPGEHIAVGSVTVLFTDLRDSTQLYREIGDAVAFARVRDHFTVLREAVMAEDGALVKTIGDSVMAVFRRPVAGLRAALRAQARLACPIDGTPPFHLKAGLHHGPCLAVTQNERLDYFGSVVNLASRLERFSNGRDIILSDAVRSDPEVAVLLADPAQALCAEPFAAQLKGFDAAEFRLWRIAVKP